MEEKQQEESEIFKIFSEIKQIRIENNENKKELNDIKQRENQLNKILNKNKDDLNNLTISFNKNLNDILKSENLESLLNDENLLNYIISILFGKKIDGNYNEKIEYIYNNYKNSRKYCKFCDTIQNYHKCSNKKIIYICKYCKKKGHIEKFCQQKMSDIQNQNQLSSFQQQIQKLNLSSSSITSSKDGKKVPVILYFDPIQ